MDLKQFVIYSDMDGTMLTNWELGPYVPKRNIDGIKRLVCEGGAFSVASGRQYRDSMPFFPQGLLNAPSVQANGALIYDCQEAVVLQKTPLPASCKEELVDYARRHEDIWLAVADADQLYELLYHDARDEKPHDMIRCKLEIEQFLSRDFMKAVFILSTPSFMPTLEKDFLKMECAKLLNRSSSSPIYLECYDKNTDKGSGVRAAVALGGLENKTLVCIGDYFNDIPMLQAADIAACPANAPEEIKAICDIVTCSNNEGAVGNLIELLSAL